MFRNYFKTSWRNIVKEKGYSTFNIVGLAIGMAVALIIGLWVQYQLSYDRFLPHYGVLLPDADRTGGFYCFGGCGHRSDDYYD